MNLFDYPIKNIKQTQEISFFTPVHYAWKEADFGTTVANFAESYFDFGEEMTLVISKRKGNCLIGKLEKSNSQSLWIVALKIISLVTIIFPLIMMAIKAFARAEWKITLEPPTPKGLKPTAHELKQQIDEHIPMPLDPEKKFQKAMKHLEESQYRVALEQFSNLALDLTLQKGESGVAEIEKAMEMAVHTFRKIDANNDSELFLEEDIWEQFFHVMRRYMDYTEETDLIKIQKEITAEIPLGSPEERNLETSEGKVFFEEHQAGPFLASVAAAQGPREEMEDAHLAVEIALEGTNGKQENIQLFAIFDGHGGAACALWVKEKLPQAIKQEFEKTPPHSDSAIYNTLRRIFIDLNNEWGELPFQKTEHIDYSGTTATVALIFENEQLWVANVGDSRTVLIAGNQAFQLSEEAKATVTKYEREIYLRGGQVQLGRVVGERGSLDMARSIGDIDQPAVSALPSIRKVELKTLPKGRKFLLLACDGLWDVVSPLTALEVCNGSANAKEAAKKLEKIAYSRGTTDNVSVMAVKL